MTLFHSKRQMLLIVTVAVAFGLMTTAGAPRAQIWGVWSNPALTAPGEKHVSAHLLVGDLTGVMGHGRMGLNEKADLGVQVGIPDFDWFDFAIAGDLRYGVLSTADAYPVDMSAVGAFGYTKAEFSSVLDFGVGAIVSKAIETQGGLIFSPFGSLMIDFAKASVDEQVIATPIGNQTVGGGSDTQTDVQFRGGVYFPLNEQVWLNGELNLGSRDEGFYLTLGGGINL